MGRSKKSLRDGTRMTGKALSETLIPSPILAAASDSEAVTERPEAKHPEQGWVTSPDLTEYGLPYALEDIQDTTLFLLQNPGLTSSVLFRADIILDIEEAVHDESHSHFNSRSRSQAETPDVDPIPARYVPGFELRRTIVRRLVPRNSQLDRPVHQTCHVYLSNLEAETEAELHGDNNNTLGSRRFLVTYTPHVSSREELPYYHPQLRALALMYEYENGSYSPISGSDSGPKDTATAKRPGSNTHPGLGVQSGSGTLSVHFLPYPPSPTTNSITSRLERTLSNLLEVQIRITKGRLNTEAPTTQSPYAAIKDNVIPRNRVQDTYSRLKIKYAADLCERWVESTEPSKHVYEDLGVAAFLVELWRDSYGITPRDESSDQPDTKPNPQQAFPGWVDIACGNGVLVYVLLSEGYPGWGFDARRRKTWGIFPARIQERLKEEIYIPKPFGEVLRNCTTSQGQHVRGEPFSPLSESETELQSSLESSLPKNTFIISNHADELTLWTPLLATLLNPTNPPPFLAIPCCSHSFSGARHRYPPQTQTQNQPTPSPSSPSTHPPEPQPPLNESTESPGKGKGDLKSLRATKLASQNPHNAAFSTSTYGALTEQLISISHELGIFPVVKTLLRIPSTRNIGVLGGVLVLPGCSQGSAGAGRIGICEENGCLSGEGNGGERGRDEMEVLRRLDGIVERGCARDGGVEVAARNWVARARGLRNCGGGSSSGHGHGHG